ncbi:GspH/FimT family pseudopilin [Marinospirillum perlucidum]|uniref:GspH/FimT family pseudopilin n=1 Tax=Marinospirillum perlucidum TaxID=1982602 RepID=UPI000DF4068E|nr:GspH/FimT family pseudopilin [Marinospirillum perlucidum]
MPQHSPQLSRHYQSGFNLIELLVVLVIAAVAFGVLLPAGESLLNRSRLIGATNEVYASLLFARNEATRRRQAFSVCALSTMNSTTCASGNQPVLAVFSGDSGSQIASGRTNPIDLPEGVSVSLNNISNQRLVFQRLGNRDPGADKAQPVFLAVSIDGQSRNIDVCFNGRILIRDAGSSQSECEQ